MIIAAAYYRKFRIPSQRRFKISSRNNFGLGHFNVTSQVFKNGGCKARCRMAFMGLFTKF